jgi:putative heme-binding domain-containing protein
MEIDRTSGRIFKIVYTREGEALAEPKLARSASEGNTASKTKTSIPAGNALRSVPSGDLAKLTDQELAKMQIDPHNENQWLIRHSRRLLQERAATKKLSTEIATWLDKEIVRMRLGSSGPPGSLDKVDLNALWTLHVIRGADLGYLGPLPIHPDSVWSQAILLACESRAPSRRTLESLKNIAGGKFSPFTRLHLASALQRIPLDDRWPIAEALLAHAEDADDPYLPLMYWYGVEPLVPRNVRKSIEFIPKIQIPLVRQYIARRLVAVREGDDGPKAATSGRGLPPTSSAWILEELMKTLAAASDPIRLDMLRGLQEAYRGRRTVAAPAAWRNTYLTLSNSESADVRESATELGVIYGDRQLISVLEDQLLHQPQLEAAIRRRGLELLATKHEPTFLNILFALLKDQNLRADAIRALANYNSPETPPKLINAYASFTPSERQDAIQTLTARPIYALVLLDAIEQGVIPRQDISALTIRQLQALSDERVGARLTKVWGNIRRASADKQEKIDAYKSRLTADALKSADLSHGRAVFAKTCANCHRLFGEGAKIAPELTGSQRHNLDYVLDNVLDPSGIVPREYLVHILRLADGRVVQGVVMEENPQTLTIQTANETLSTPIAEIEARKQSPLSMMPEGLFDRLSAEEVRDLVAYLASPQQVPLPMRTDD